MKLDLKGFQKVSKEGNTTTLRHPEGHEITVNHSILSPKMRGEIEALPRVNKMKTPDSDLRPKFADGGESDESVSLPEQIVNMAKKAFNSPTPKPSPNPDLEEKYSKIREQNKTNASGETSPLDQKVYAEGGDVKEENKDIGIDLSQDPKELHITPKEQTQDEKDIAQAKADYDKSSDDTSGLQNLKSLGTEATQEQASNPAQSMLDAHNDAMEAHNTAMKLFAGAQPQANQNPQPQTAQAAPSQPQPTQPNQPAVPQDVPQQPVAGQPSAGPVPDYQKTINQGNAAVQEQKDYIDKQEAANTKLGQDVLTDKVNPNRLYQNMSTGGKIASTIGLILGGLGAGATGGKNLAVEAMQKAIETDVDAQKANQSSAMNLYKMNLEATHNGVEARNLTINQLMSAAQAQLAKRAADTTNQNGQLEAQKAIQDIQAKKMENAQNAYKFKTLEELSNSSKANVPPGQVDLDKFNKYKLAGVMPKEDSEAATKEANAYQEKQVLKKDMDESAAHLNKQLLAGALTPSDRQSAINAFAGRIAKLGEGRFNLEESKLQAQALLPSPLDAPSTSRNKDQRRAAFFDSIAQTPTLDRYKLVSHAPAAAPIKKMGGVSYQLGPDGNYHKLGK